MIRFVHTADIHFGMENYGRIDAKTGMHSRLLDFQKAVNVVIDKAIAENVDLFLFAGDAYKTHNPTPTHQRLLTQCFFRLYQAGIPVVMVVGNHDNPLSYGRAHALEIFGQLPIDGFYVISQPTTIKIETKSGPVQVVGIPWPTRSILALNNRYIQHSAHELADYIGTALASIIKQHAEQLDSTIPAVLVGHLTVSSGIFSGSEKRAIYGSDPVLLPSQLAIEPFDYIALGHLHRYQNLNTNGYPAIVYSGSPERIDFGERKEDKGFCLVTIYEKNNTKHEFIKTPTRPFIQIKIYIKAENNQTDQILEELKKYDLTNAIVKVIYYLSADLRDTVDITVINHACKAALQVIGIFGIRDLPLKTKRPALKVEMNLPTLLDYYFENRTDLKKNREELIKIAMSLELEVSDPENLELKIKESLDY